MRKYIIKNKFLIIFFAIFIPLIILFTFFFITTKNTTTTLNASLLSAQSNVKKLEKELSDLKNQDQFKRNEILQAEIKNLELSYSKAVKMYETIQDLDDQKIKTTSYKEKLTLALSYLSKRNFASGSAELTALEKQITSDQQKTAATSTSPAIANAPSSNTPPGTGFSTQKVTTEIGEYTVSLIAADMGSTRIIVDTASDSDCRDNCPVLSLGDYVSRNGAFAGINGSYFCPASYPSCAGKTNTFDTLLMNKNKTYFNSDNNVYSSVPVVVFGGGFMRFIGQSSGWGRDTSVDSVLANQPLLLSGGNITFSGDGDPKKGSKGSRSFVGNKGSTAYIGVVYNATVAEGAYALKALGLENALNLDSGGSTALWSGGYKVGPGRNIPNAILFVRK
ncbi:MAG: hypothetical protein QG600_472 [Patescibacteria group bacterium]|jgi:hypothetical protein|nr:hypothetical protein [Patescibacteria group bacterium]